MPSWLGWLLDELDHLKQFPRLAIGLVMLGALGGWHSAQFLSRTQISNLKSEVALLKSQLATTAKRSLGPLPSYSLGGSGMLIHTSPDWITQQTAKPVELPWDRLVNIDAYAVLQMRTESIEIGEESASAWVQGRIMNITNNEVVGTTEMFTGGKISERLALPRATSAKRYSMQVRGKNAGLEGHIELVPIAP